MKIVIRRLTDAIVKDWVAYDDDLEPDTTSYGMGTTPQLALDDFLAHFENDHRMQCR